MAHRREFVGALAFVLPARSTPVVAEAVGRSFRIAIVRPAGPTDVDGIPKPLRDLGEVEGRNIRIDRRDADGRPGRLPALFDALVRSPTGCAWHGNVQRRGPSTDATSLPDTVLQLAHDVDRVFNEAKAADLPVVQPTRFALTIKLKTARALGPVVPEALLLRADAVLG